MALHEAGPVKAALGAAGRVFSRRVLPQIDWVLIALVAEVGILRPIIQLDARCM